MMRNRFKQIFHGLIPFSELLGILVSWIIIILKVIFGENLEDIFFDKAYDTLDIAKVLRPIASELFVISIILLFGVTIFFIYHNVRLARQNNDRLSLKWDIFRFVPGFLIGYIFAESLIYFLLNGLFFRNVFVTIPYALGFCLLLLTLIVLFLDDSLVMWLYQLINRLDKISLNKKKYLKIAKILFFFIFSLILIIPNIVPMTGLLPTPPGQPITGYNTTDRPYDTARIRLEQKISTEIAPYLLPDNNNDSWYSWVYMPLNSEAKDQSYPVAIFLHGFTGTDVALYDYSMRLLASRGVVVIFVQYVTNLDLNGFDLPDNTNITNAAELYIRYSMMWDGIQQVVDTMNNSNTFDYSSNLGNNYTIDLSHLLIFGHSMGGGMALYIAEQSVKMGWGMKQLILDLEAPWYAATWESVTANLTILPDNTMINVVGYEDDTSVNPCIGMRLFERFRLRDNTNLLDENKISYLIIRSDRYGFPRLVATHYVPNDPLIDSLFHYGYAKRIDAMAAYLVALIENDATTSENSLLYFTGGTSQMRSMGEWSDGRPVNPLHYSIDPFGLRGTAGLVSSLVDANHEACET